MGGELGVSYLSHQNYIKREVTYLQASGLLVPKINRSVKWVNNAKKRTGALAKLQYKKAKSNVCIFYIRFFEGCDLMPYI